MIIHFIKSFWNPSHDPAQIKNRENSKTILIFFSDEHKYVLYIRTKFLDKITFMLICTRKTKSLV